MTKVLPILLLAGLFWACGGNSGSADAGSKPAQDLSANPDYQKGMALIAKNDCLTCHKIDEKLIGPAYRDVANKYAGAPDTAVTYLAHKIMKGGTGVWGEVAMAAHPNLTEEDAMSLAKYVLLLKN